MHLNISFYLVDYASLCSRNRRHWIAFQPSSKVMPLLLDPIVGPKNFWLGEHGVDFKQCTVHRDNEQHMIIYRETVAGECLNCASREVSPLSGGKISSNGHQGSRVLGGLDIRRENYVLGVREIAKKLLPHFIQNIPAFSSVVRGLFLSQGKE